MSRIKYLLFSTCVSLMFLGACAKSPMGVTQQRVVPDVPADLASCFKRSFPEIPDRDLTSRDVIRIIADAKKLDRLKTACGERAVKWMHDVRDRFSVSTEVK